MTDSGRIDRARARTTEAKRRMGDTLTALKARLDPQRVAKDAVEGLVDHSAQALQSGVDTVKRHPAPVIGAAAFLTAFLNRKWLFGLVRRKPRAKRAQPASPVIVRSPEITSIPPKRKRK